MFSSTARTQLGCITDAMQCASCKDWGALLQKLCWGSQAAVPAVTLPDKLAWSSSASAAAASLQPLPSSCSRSLLVGECWEPLLDILWAQGLIVSWNYCSLGHWALLTLVLAGTIFTFLSLPAEHGFLWSFVLPRPECCIQQTCTLCAGELS